MQCKPWDSTFSSCYLLVIDCHELNVAGSNDEVTAVWSSIEPTTTTRLVIRHCPNLEVPKQLTEFSQLTTLKFYNTTISRWNEDAAISQSNHPNLMQLFVVRVNMTNGELPLGLQSNDFPTMLTDIEFCVTNLNSLPDDLDTKWPQAASIFLEASNLTEVPVSMQRLAPYDFSVARNPVSTIPASMFNANVGYLRFSETNITELPENVSSISEWLILVVDNTNVSFFWSWIDPAIVNEHSVPLLHTIEAHNAPYCLDLQRIYDGEQSSFSKPFHDNQSMLLMNASATNWDALRNSVSCDKRRSPTWYPLDIEDEYSKIL